MTTMKSQNVQTKAERRKRKIGRFRALSAIHRRYTEHPPPRVPYRSLQGVTVLPVPCNYFHGGNTGSNPVGNAKPFQELASNRRNFHRHKKAQL
jgi:hypothetical protein